MKNLDHSKIYRILSVLLLVWIAFTKNYILVYIYAFTSFIYAVIVIGFVQQRLTIQIRDHYPDLYKKYQMGIGDLLRSDRLQKIDLTGFSKEDLDLMKDPDLRTEIEQLKSNQINVFTFFFLTVTLAIIILSI
ncbi:hypothetical protein [Xanthocytophaga agilis]|uniref:Uncharacterized protein n=1 Tax=Xanthocytophaga agilis TaxID=3048010 RepID=A0AAE3RD40_9BACT|nr:hypothetical protein [Xanthocytophaga agilis]MDJ1506365.1 hypothetical protein [Xanthocytophaga agilis]